MDEMANPSGPRKELVNNHCNEFMQLVKDIQMMLQEDIKSARPFEKCDYVPRISNEICCKKLEYVVARLDWMKRDMYTLYNCRYGFILLQSTYKSEPPCHRPPATGHQDHKNWKFNQHLGLL
ncbi:hypothetical protein Pfo_023189, partial [Paulownia fortunei]